MDRRQRQSTSLNSRTSGRTCRLLRATLIAQSLVIGGSLGGPWAEAVAVAPPPGVCDPGLTPAVFPIAASADDGWVRRVSASAEYPPSGAITVYTTDPRVLAERSLYNGQFYIDNTLLRWNTATLPGGVTVVSAAVQVTRPVDQTDRNVDGRNITADWYDWSSNGGIDASDYSETARTTALAAFTLSIPDNQTTTIPLDNTTGVNPGGYTYLRLHVDGGPPQGVNQLDVASEDDGTLEPPTLILCYTSGTPPPTRTPTNTPTSTPTAGPDAFVYTSPDVVPENTWVKLSSPPTLKYLPHDFTFCDSMGLLPNPIGRVRCGVAYGDGTLLYFGGGDKGHPGNDVEIYDINANLWVQKYAPECVPSCCCVPECKPENLCSGACAIIGGVGTTELTPSGRPYTEHTYRLVAYNPSRHKFSAALTSGMWEWDPATMMWTQLTPTRPVSNDIATKHLAYDPDVGMIYFVTAPLDGPPAVYVFNYTDSVWVKFGNMPQEILDVDGWGEFDTAYDPKRRVHLASHVASRNTFWVFDAKTGTPPNAGTWTRVTDAPDAVLGAASFDYDPTTDLFVAAKSDASGVVALWSFRDGAGWNQLAPIGARPAGAFFGEWGGMLNYDSLTGRFYLVNPRGVSSSGTGGIGPGDVETWTYQPPQSAVGDANCDGQVSAADVPAYLLQGSAGSNGGCITPIPATLTQGLDSLLDALFAPTASGIACADPGDTRATFAIKRSEDDAIVRAGANSYPLNAGASRSADATNANVGVFRTGQGGTDYAVYVGLLRWDTSSLPDGASVKQAWLRFHVVDAKDADVLQLTAGWYDWSSNGVADVGDWTPTPETGALSGTNISDLTAGSWNVVPLSGFDQGVSTTGLSYLRLHISERPNDEAPTDQNYVTFSAFDSGQPAELIVCYSPRPRAVPFENVRRVADLPRNGERF